MKSYIPCGDQWLSIAGFCMDRWYLFFYLFAWGLASLGKAGGLYCEPLKAVKKP
jgi:hypothetical protein